MLEQKVFDSEHERVVVLQFEHSLRSISKWEQKHRKPFLSKQHTAIEMMEYFECMVLNDDVDPKLVFVLSPEQLKEVGDYINDYPGASSVPQEGGSGGVQETITSELVYYWMTELKIPWEAQDWNYNRLSMLIQITNYKKQPPKKRSMRDHKASWQAANEAARKRFNSKG